MRSKDASPCLIVVEDQADSRSALARLLRLSGYTVHTAASVREALEVAARHGCDLLIADISLADGSGLDVMRHLRAAHGLKRGIAMSGHTTEDVVKACFDAGFSKFLPKPLSFPALLTEVQRLV